MIDLKQVKSLIRLMVENDLNELDVEAEGEKVRLRRGVSGGPPTLVHAGPAPVATPAPAPPVPASAPPAPASDDANLVAIRSPMVGTFYSAPSPDAKPFVAVGDSVTEETVVCIIEAMKVFNEIKAERSGTIAKVLVANGQAVEFDQPLYMIRPA